VSTEYPSYDNDRDVSLLRKQTNEQLLTLISKAHNLKFADTIYAIMHERCLIDPSDKNIDDFNLIGLRRQAILEICLLDADINAPDIDSVVIDEQINEGRAAHVNRKR
jgi:hypothetical protein